MDASSRIQVVRAFNRAVARNVGALTDCYLGRGRSLGEARVLWEIGEHGCEVRTLRARLALDSGYLSRLLRALEAAGLIEVTAGEHDKRTRAARLTKKGKSERAVLDRRSNVLAESMLGPLSEAQRDRLVSAMAEVEQLLTASTIEIAQVDPAHPHARYCVYEYFAELDRRLATGFDPAASLPVDPDEVRPPAGVFLLATQHQAPVGCGALKFHAGQPTELKRLWVSPAVRGLGVGRRLLQALETRASQAGSRSIRLDTNGALSEAVAMYRSAGYRDVSAYNDEPYADHWFEKDLEPAPTSGPAGWATPGTRPSSPPYWPTSSPEACP